jgi:hypothetical protein
MRTIREANVGKLRLRLLEKDGVFLGLIFSADGGRKAQIQGDSPNNVWRQLHDEAGKANPKYFGFDGARARFLRFFPDGFRSERYAKQERDYKVAAKSKLERTVPLTEAAAGSGLGEAVLSVFRATNLLYPLEKSRLQPLLRGPDADTFIRAAAQFAIGEMKPALLKMERVLKPYDSAKWTVVTYLPFLWRPEAHMFLKPEVTKDFAARVGHRFASDYEPRLDIGVYESLLELVAETSEQLAELRPRDRIDVQSFIWAVSYYDQADEIES